ncbi:MAG TPA: nicotinate (nicotinamide) nucleotide adenylyltransferase [Phycisphaerae bacterium]|nr:nicotinate (nicotinamide) nucleotide adenylyltransferase [Phycisphaerae bacterium]
MARIGILGGTFDPIHLGHLIPATYACNHLSLDRLLLVPSASPVHRPLHQPAAAAHRLAMCRLAAAALPPFDVSDTEVARSEPSYTVLTLEHLAARFGQGSELILLVGEDNLHLLHTWRRLDEILRLASVAVLPRPIAEPPDLAPLEAAIGKEGVAALLARGVPSPLIPISATEIRRRIRAGMPITGLVPTSVAAYIAENGLYAEAGEARP